MKEKRTEKKINRNREFTVIAYFFFIIFIALMAYFIYFQVVKSEDFINSPYNSLQDLFSENIIRGEIISSDGYVDLDKLETDLTKHTALNTLNTYLLASGLRSDLVVDSLKTAYTLETDLNNKK